MIGVFCCSNEDRLTGISTPPDHLTTYTVASCFCCLSPKPGVWRSRARLPSTPSLQEPPR